MQVRITDPALVKKLKRLAFQNDSSVPLEVARQLQVSFSFQRKVKAWSRARALKISLATKTSTPESE